MATGRKRSNIRGFSSQHCSRLSLLVQHYNNIIVYIIIILLSLPINLKCNLHTYFVFIIIVLSNYYVFEPVCILKYNVIVILFRRYILAK